MLELFETPLTVLHIFVCLFLILVVLIQPGKSGGLGAALGGAGAQQVFGGRGAGNFLSRATWICASTFFVTSMVLAYISSSADDSLEGRSGSGAASEKSSAKGDKDKGGDDGILTPAAVVSVSEPEPDNAAEEPSPVASAAEPAAEASEQAATSAPPASVSFALPSLSGLKPGLLSTPATPIAPKPPIPPVAPPKPAAASSAMVVQSPAVVPAPAKPVAPAPAVSQVMPTKSVPPALPLKPLAPAAPAASN